MANYSMMDNTFSPLRQADGKVLGRVRPMVKMSTPQAGMKDVRFFVDPLSPLPKGYEEAGKFGFTGFMSRIGFGFNSFPDEDTAAANLESVFGDCFVTFKPALRNNKYFVLDDMEKEGRTPFMNTDKNYYPVPAFGTLEQPVFNGDINKFCHHILTGKPLPGLSKKFWNNDIPPRLIVAATKNYENKLGPWVVFAPLYDDAFDSTVIGEGGAYFKVRGRGPLGYAVVDSKNSELMSHILRCKSSPLWFVPEEFMPDLRLNLKPVPMNGDLLKDAGVKYNPFDELDEGPAGYYSRDESKPEPPKTETIIQKDIEPIVESLSSMEEAPVNDAVEEVVSRETSEKVFTEMDFLHRLQETAEGAGLLYDKKDLINFHISVKSSRLVVLAGMSGTGKSGLVRLYGKALGLPEERVRFLPVRPSWMDDGDILGYVDMKNMVYRSADTGLAELLIDAAAHPEQLYMVCFDEMNLARAEHYFAQFISVLEKEENPVIRLYNPALAPRLYNSEKYPADIPVGRNVIFTGTVNVDESTYHFSDKILDRANVITLHQGRFRDLMGLSRKEIGTLPEVTAEQFLSFRVDQGLGLTEKELDLLDELNDAFKKSGISCGIGFRIACQMGRYLENIPQNNTFHREEGLDAQVVQRILTKLRGSSQQLSSLVSLNEKGNLEGTIVNVLSHFNDLSDFVEAKAVLEGKARELKLYDYTI